jgi:hypothetical protein|tara:strand:+ start:101 stop:964 length:864 start_codon:yes stop_codon:yes gene_type:complete
MPEIERSGANPLQKYFRQPKIYIKLPSNGRWYPNGSLEVTDNMEFPVYAMTARDELMFKTPDALLNGQSTVDVIQSCVPNIKNGWDIPTLDIDTLLVAIRIATYGEKLELTSKIPNTKLERKFDLDLRVVLDKFQNVAFDDTLTIDELTLTVRPQTYREFTKVATKTFEEQRIASVIQEDDMTEEQKLEIFNQAFQRLTSITVDMVMQGIVSIQTGEDVVTDKLHIQQFIQNADKKFYSSVVESMESQKKKFTLEPITVDATEEEIKEGAPKQWEMPVSFDQSNFFV